MSKIIEKIHDKLGRLTFYKKDNGFWVKQTFKNNHRVYYEDSEGLVEINRYNRHGEMTYEKIIENGNIISEKNFIN